MSDDAEAARSPIAAAARVAAARLGVLAARRAGAATVDEIAAATGLQPRRLGALAAVLDGLDAWDDAPPDDAPGAAALVETLRRDRPPGPDLRRDAAALAVGRLLGERTGGPKHELAQRIAPLLGAGVFLDAGGGLGDVTLAVLAAAPEATAVLVDLPPVAMAARRRLPPARTTVLAADLRLAELPQVRVALLSNVLHMHGPEDAACILARVAAAVAPGGALLVKDLRPGPLRSALFDLAAAVFSEEGRVHDEATVRDTIEAAGLEIIERTVPASAPEAVLFTAVR